MFFDSGTAEQTEEPQQVISEPCQDQGETPGDSDPGPFTAQSAPVTMSMLESTLRYEMASGYRTITMGEPSGSFAFSQKDMSADQTKSPASSQLMKLKDQETSLTDIQERAVSDSEETVYKECRYVKVPFGKETFVFQPTPLCGSQRNSPGDSQGTHLEGQLLPLEGDCVRSFNAEQTWDEDHEVPSVLDQQMPVTAEKTFKCSQIATRVGEPFPYEGRMSAPSYSQALHPSELISSFSLHTSCQYKKMVLSRDKDLFRDHLVSIKGYEAFYKHQTRDLSSTQINHYGQMVSSHGQNVSTGQGTVPSVEEHQMRDLSSTQINHYGQLVSSRGQNVSTGQGTVPSVEEHQMRDLSSTQVNYYGRLVSSRGHNVSTGQGTVPSVEEHQMRDLSSTQINHYGQLVSSCGQNVSTGQGIVPRVEEHQMRDLSSTQVNYYGQLVSSHGQNVSTGQGTVPSVEEHQMRDLSSTQVNYYGRLVSSCGHNVSTGQGTVPSVEECRRRQETFNPPFYSGGPLASRLPPESASVSANVWGQLHQDSSFVETKSHDSQKTHNWKPYFCPYDDGETSFPMSSLLGDHRRTHTGELPYACDHPQCGLKFPCLDNLLSHRREHMVEHPYCCSYCNQGFTRLDDLRMHSRQHFSTLS